MRATGSAAAVRLAGMTSKQTLREDLTAALRARDQVRTGTLRMTLAAVQNAEVAGKEHHELSDDEVLQVITKEAKKRRESAEAYEQAGREELAATERAELAILTEYLPQQLSDAEIDALIQQAIAQTGADGMAAMGSVMKIVQPQTAGRADGKKVAAAVRSALAG